MYNTISYTQSVMQKVGKLKNKFAFIEQMKHLKLQCFVEYSGLHHACNIYLTDYESTIV